jgi:hypothetical protein
MGFQLVRDPASQMKAVGLTAQSGVAAGTGDNTELTSAAVDRMIVGGIGFLSGLFVINYLTTLTAAATLKATVKIADSDDGTTFGSDTTLASAVTLATGALTAAAGAYELGVDLSAYKQYVRFKVTLDLSASGTDTFVYGSGVILAGADRLPA